MLFGESPKISFFTPSKVRKIRFPDRLHMRIGRLLSEKMKYRLSTLIPLFIDVSCAVVVERKVSTAQPIQKLQAVDADPI